MTTTEQIKPSNRVLKRAKKEKDILDEARQMLREQNGGGFSFRRLADRLNMRLGHLQYYYPQLPDLLVALYHQFMTDEVIGFKERYFVTKGTKRQKLTAAMNFLFEDPEYLKNSITFFSRIDSLAGGDSRLEEARTRYRFGEQEVVRELVSDLNPDLDEEDKSIIAVQVGTMLNGAMGIHRIPSNFNRRELAGIIAEAILMLATSGR